MSRRSSVGSEVTLSLRTPTTQHACLWQIEVNYIRVALHEYSIAASQIHGQPKRLNGQFPPNQTCRGRLPRPDGMPVGGLTLDVGGDGGGYSTTATNVGSVNKAHKITYV